MGPLCACGLPPLHYIGQHDDVAERHHRASAEHPWLVALLCAPDRVVHVDGRSHADACSRGRLLLEEELTPRTLLARPATAADLDALAAGQPPLSPPEVLMRAHHIPQLLEFIRWRARQLRELTGLRVIGWTVVTDAGPTRGLALVYHDQVVVAVPCTGDPGDDLDALEEAWHRDMTRDEVAA